MLWFRTIAPIRLKMLVAFGIMAGLLALVKYASIRPTILGDCST